ncbi:hypothetical protein AAH978_10150 [Streptomyces sp. ZYX-F-203]
MSQLLAAAGMIAPVIAAAGGAVLQSAQDRAADAVVLGARDVVRDVLDRGNSAPPGDAEREAARQIGTLSEAELRELYRAVDAWLADPGQDLTGLIRREAVGHNIHVEASGTHATTFGYVHNLGGLHTGDRRQGDSREDPGLGPQ